MPDTDTVKDNTAPQRELEFTLPFSQIPDRLDKVLAGLIPEHSRSRLQGWIESGSVQVNGQLARVRQQVYPGDHVRVREQASDESRAFEPENIPLDIVHSTGDWIVVNKPAGLVTHPGAGNWSGTLLNALLYHFPELQQVPRAGIVHRLDKDTSGVMVVARHDKAQTHLVRQLQARTMGREYRALVHGTLSGSGVINSPIGRDRRVPVRMTSAQPIAPKDATTHYSAVRQSALTDVGAVTDVICQLQTGRTHQIRVHLSYLGHPLLGDKLYGGRIFDGCGRQMLHARTLRFVDIHSGGEREFHAPWPADFQALCERLWQA